MATSYRTPRPTTQAPTVVSQSTGYTPTLTRDQRENGIPTLTAPSDPSNTGGMFGRLPDAIISGLTGGKLTDHRVFLADLAKRRAAAAAGGGAGGGGSSSGASYALAQMQLKAAGQPYDRAIDQLGKDFGNNKNAAILGGKRQDADLSQLFSRLTNYTGERRQNAAEGYRKTQGEVGSNYDKMLRDVAASYSKGAGNTTAELQRLGIGEVSPSAMAGLARDGSNILNQTRVDKANSSAVLGDQRRMLDGLMMELMGSAQVEGTTQRGKARQGTADALAALTQQYAKDKAELSGKKADALLQARMANLRASVAASQARSRSGGSGKKSAAAKPGKGFDAAYNWLTQYSGGNASKAADLREELRFLSTSPQGNDPLNPNGQKFGYSDPLTLNHLYNEWAGPTGSGTKKGYTKDDAAAIQRAIAMIFGKA